MRLARQIGRAPRVLSGWVPTPDDPSEWNQNQREMMFALAEAEADICPGCGGFLSFTTLRDHLYDVSRRECQQCVAIHTVNERWDKDDDQTKGTPAEWVPSARRISIKPIPLPPEAYEHAKREGLLGPREES